VIRGGTIVDGTGKPAFTGDLAFDGGRIAAVGAVGRGRREIDAAGLLVTPGFVDLHTHYDAQATWDPMLSPSSWHGVTTAVMGNCGVGFAPAAPDRHPWLIGLMEGVEDIPGAAMTEGITWEWESFPEYLDALARRSFAIDLGTQVPHGALRAYVMGDRGAANQPATPDDIAQMAALVHEALDAGALGFSTSRTSLHRSIDGELVPGTFATRDELFGIGAALAAAGKGVYQLACEHGMVPSELPWMAELAAEIQRPVSFNLSQFDFAPDLWKRVLTLLQEVPAHVPLVAQVAGRPIGVLMNWRITAHPFARHPTFLAMKDQPWDEQLAALRRPDVRARLLTEKPGALTPFEQFVAQSFHKMYRLGAVPDYEPDPATSLAAEAKRTGQSALELAYDAMMADDGRGLLYFPLFNYSDGNLDLLEQLHQHPRTRMGLSDGGAHCGAICDGGMPSFMLQFWTRDRSRGGRLGIEHVIRRQTSETAALYGLGDRGVLAPGYLADVNLIDYDRMFCPTPQVVYDLPAGGRRLVQRAEGYVATFKSGVQTFDRGAPTGLLPGRVLRGARSVTG
jgi:N-acyl-D-aspartate/D-glutamate deacylase